MGKGVKRILAAGLAFMLMLSLAAPGASAAVGPEDIHVQLNGQELAFTDVSPFAENGRTYVPFRALFEALGAAVDYDADTMTVTAVRGDTAVSFVVGRSEMILKTGDTAETVAIDAPAVARNNRTFVPARFAAQALGCNVGWDSYNRTVVIDDVDAILDANAATYTVMDKYLGFFSRLTASPHAVRGTVGVKINSLSPETESGGIDLEINGDVSGLVDRDRLAMDVLITTNLLELAQKDAAQRADVQNLMLASLLYNIRVEFLLNLETGMIYTRSDWYNQMQEIEEGTWISQDLNEMTEGYYMTGGTLISLSSLLSTMLSPGSFRDSLAVLLRMNSLTDKDYTATTVLQHLNTLFSDQVMTATGSGYVSTYADEQGGYTISLESSCTMNGESMTGCSVQLEQVTEDGSIVVAKVGLNAAGMETFSVTVTQPSEMELVVEGSLQFTETSEQPAPCPADGPVIAAGDLY